MFKFSLPFRPLYFLSAVGAGGLSVSVFMYFMFLTSHSDTPMPTYETVVATLAGGLMAQVLVVPGLIAFAALVLLHLVLMVVNLREYARFRRTDAFRSMLGSHTELSLMAIPLALAMTVNVLFVSGALTVPGLWSRIEYLFPVSILAFLLVGGYGLAVFGRYLGRTMSSGSLDMEYSNHFAQLMPSFAFIMVGVGLAAPAAMSKNLTTSAVGLVGSLFFVTVSLLWVMVKVPVSMGRILRQGVATESAPTLWIGIPILTLLGITFVRLNSAVSHNFLHIQPAPVLVLIVLGLVISAQVLMGLAGWSVMRRKGYFRDFVFGPKRSIASYGLVCPGVALFVLSMFFIDWGLVRTGVVARLSAVHIGLVLLAAVVQVATIALMIRLNAILLSGPPAEAREPATEARVVTPV